MRFYLLIILNFLFLNTYTQINKKGLELDTVLLKEHISFWSDPSLKGRLPGTQEYNVACNYAENYYDRFGLKLFSNYNHYRQNLIIKHNRFLGPCDFEILDNCLKSHKPIHGEAYNFRGYTGSGNFSANTVFCGFGIEHEDYNDYKNVEVKDKVVLIFKTNPQFKLSNLAHFSISCRAKTAKDKGALAVIFIPNPNSTRKEPVGSVMFGDCEYMHNLPLIQTDLNTANIFFSDVDIDLHNLYNTINETKKPLSKHLNTSVSINVKTEFTDSAETYNIVGFVEGVHPDLKNEFILITAHLDHVGNQCDLIYPGANDNASGCAAVLELARIFTQKENARSIVFALFSGEEQGLIGAEYFVKNLPIPPDKIIAALNIDCIATGDSIQIGNGLSSPELYSIARSFDTNKLIVQETWKGGGADLTPINDAGIPGLYFVTKYSYTHLHLPSDTPETLNIKLLKQTVELAYNLVSFIAEGNYQREEVRK